MKSIVKILIFLMAILCPEHIAWSQELDSLKQKALSDKLDEYFMAIEREGTQVQKQESDFLIESASDSLTRQFIALKTYEHYLNSPVMGSEAVAIHILDKWFLPGKVKMKNDIDLLNARVYADFNRQSQVGMKAPQLDVTDIDGKALSLFGDDALEGQGGRFSILYFYDTDCAKCRMESMLLRKVLEERNYPLNLYAFYSGDDREAWKKYASLRLNIDADAVRICHLWDPEVNSDFQRKYGVLQTPRMYLIRPDGMIAGRGLDTDALLKMLVPLYETVSLDYGSGQSSDLFDGIFADDEGTIAPSRETVARLVDYIRESTLPQGDTLTFRQLSGDLLYYLASRSGEGFKEGLKYHIDNNVKAVPGAWDSQDDSLKVVGMAEMFDDLLSRTAPGSLVPDLKIPGVLLSKGKEKVCKRRLGKLRGESNYIMFVTYGCNVCASEKAAARRLVDADSRTEVFLVNVDDIQAADNALAVTLFDSFDLSSLPFILKTDRKGKFSRRYMSLAQ